MPALKTTLPSQLLTVTVLVTVLAVLSPVRGDFRVQADAIHQELEAALNPGGPAPSDADRTTHLNTAWADLKTLPAEGFHNHRVRAMRDIKAALHEIEGGDANHQAAEDIREADFEVRELSD